MRYTLFEKYSQFLILIDDIFIFIVSVMKYTGLSSKEVSELLSVYGHNHIKEHKQRGLVDILWEQAKGNFMIYFMVFAAILSFAVAKTTTAYAIL